MHDVPLCCNGLMIEIAPDLWECDGCGDTVTAKEFENQKEREYDRRQERAADAVGYSSSVPSLRIFPEEYD